MSVEVRRTLVDHELVRVRYSRRPASGFMGRFGGGWNWKVGVQVGGHSMIVELLVASVRVDWGRRRRP